ncbi:MAG: Type 1 glutamine amidotransferase-like domain-containing protein [Lachnospiraceae bacterium]|nr:Type 1 glutamine amidotransferase-like domain-containing protein [Lachnospiraceae bacterium]
MKAMLTSSLGGAIKMNGKRIPDVLIQQNGLLDKLKSIWPQDARVLIVCANPDNHEKNDGVYACLKEALPMSGLSVSYLAQCDDRNPDIIENLPDMDVIILAGGHVPTQNKFMKQLRLKERLSEFEGILVAWSAGSMNCAEVVYAGPELEGEALDPLYERWIPGLGITNINIYPHFQKLRDEYFDGMRLIEDITFEDSVGHEIIALNDGSYIMIENGQTTLYGEAYRIQDRQLTQLCKDGEFIVL